MWQVSMSSMKLNNEHVVQTVLVMLTPVTEKRRSNAIRYHYSYCSLLHALELIIARCHTAGFIWQLITQCFSSGIYMYFAFPKPADSNVVTWLRSDFKWLSHVGDQCYDSLESLKYDLSLT